MFLCHFLFISMIEIEGQMQNLEALFGKWGRFFKKKPQNPLRKECFSQKSSIKYIFLCESFHFKAVKATTVFQY